MSGRCDARQYDTLHFLTSGSKTNVYLVRYIPTGKLLVGTQFDLERYDSDDFSKLGSMVAPWSTLVHPNLLAYHGSFVDGQVLWFLTEFADGGSLSNILEFRFKDGFTDEILIASILKEIIDFIHYYHSHRCVHRDLQVSNIFLTSHGEVKVGGLWSTANMIESGHRPTMIYSAVESSCYSAPEALEGVGYTETVDIWSLGIIAIELATGVLPRSNLSPSDRKQAIIQQDAPQLPSHIPFSEPFRDFVKMCLKKDPSKRASAKQLLASKFMKIAKGQEYILKVLMLHLPPLTQRLSVVNGNRSPNELSESEKTDVEFSFQKQTNIEPENVREQHSVKHGRFVITRSSEDSLVNI